MDNSEWNGRETGEFASWKDVPGRLDKILEDPKPTGLDRSIPVSYWCDCLLANEAYFGTSVRTSKRSPGDKDMAFTTVPTDKTKDNACVYCGYSVIMKRMSVATGRTNVKQRMSQLISRDNSVAMKTEKKKYDKRK